MVAVTTETVATVELASDNVEVEIGRQTAIEYKKTWTCSC